VPNRPKFFNNSNPARNARQLFWRCINVAITRLPTHIKQKTKMNDKQDCIESLTGGLKSTSAWRKVTSARFPDDTRNVKAAKILDRLAVEAINLTDTQWIELSTYFGWASEAWRNGLNQTSRQIGFFHRTGDLDVFIKILIQNLSASCVAA
jgi:hypothetical protein